MPATPLAPPSDTLLSGQEGWLPGSAVCPSCNFSRSCLILSFLFFLLRFLRFVLALPCTSSVDSIPEEGAGPEAPTHLPCTGLTLEDEVGVPAGEVPIEQLLREGEVRLMSCEDREGEVTVGEARRRSFTGRVGKVRLWSRSWCTCGGEGRGKSCGGVCGCEGEGGESSEGLSGCVGEGGVKGRVRSTVPAPELMVSNS